MDDYLFVFDNTPYTEHMQDYMTISIGLKNQDAVQVGVETQYNKTSPLYAPSKDDTTTDATKNYTKVKPVQDDDDSTEPIDIPPMTDDGPDSTYIDTDTE
jgi:hypothetical protein